MQIGIDIGGTSVKVCAHKRGDSRFAQSSAYRNPSRSQLILAIQDALGQLGVVSGESVSVGLCLPGKQTADHKMIERSVNLPCLDGWVFEDLLHESFESKPSRYVVMGDVEAAGHDYMSAHPSKKRSAIIGMGTGVGLVVFDGDMPVGIGVGGIGHLGMIDMGRLGKIDVVAPDGSKNTLESYVGAREIERRVVASGLSGVKELIGSLAMNEPTMTCFVRMIRVVHAIYVPNRVVLMGGIGLSLALRGQELKAEVDDGLTSVADREWSLHFGDSLYHAASGAAMLAGG